MKAKHLSPIQQRFELLSRQGRKAFVPYLSLGNPELSSCRDLALMLEDCGADILELGLPFTDPIADGPTNQRAAQRAIEAGIRAEHLAELTAELRGIGFSLPIVLFTYYNPLIQLRRRGLLGDLLKDIDGVLVTDLPPEEAQEHIGSCRESQLDTIFLASPTTPSSRLAQICAVSSGFLYCVSSEGVTGSRSELPKELESRVTELKQTSALPVCVGFGISRREQAERVCQVADGYVIGSALGAVIEDAWLGGADPVAAAREFVRKVDPRGP